MLGRHVRHPQHGLVLADERLLTKMLLLSNFRPGQPCASNRGHLANEAEVLDPLDRGDGRGRPGAHGVPLGRTALFPAL